MKKLLFCMLIGGVLGYMLGTGVGVRLGSSYSIQMLTGEKPSTWMTQLGVDSIVRNQLDRIAREGSTKARHLAAEYLTNRINTVLVPSDEVLSGSGSSSLSQ